MKKNIGTIDRAIRVVAGLVILGLGYYFQSWWGLIGLLPIVTAAIGYCPPYQLLGIDTCKAPQTNNPPTPTPGS